MSSASTRSREVTVLAVLLAVAVVIIGMLLMRPPAAAPGAGATATAPSSGAPSTGTPATPGKVKDTARRQPGDPMALGRVDAPVVMVEYADYACPFCAKFAVETQPELVRRYVDRGVLRIEWHDLVIFGEKSQRAAQAARAAAQQGRFWQFHDALFRASPTSGHPDLTDDRLLGFAREAGVPDLPRYQRDLASGAVAEAVSAETQVAQQLGASSTPVFVINGTPVVGAQPLEAFVQVIDRAAAAAQR
ncbi:DsbA family protein [Arsenicicoccus sp. oral taxon 190]|uniref:DsbA family protein n=1 Tax=Arsenicicoccus sp. oral taxon 190 TaxID=1658671 RepID=UPI00067A320B|nr:thioredoxin domain-containing protein [Arsenicicoccus sp. oral taxon 190]AKT50455.1 disulfide bond formation protein [Arsenicicoccus sp. oral taxon 190]